ncbi:helix-turn-helix domain-containing protein [Bosea minatitlanensis]|uniref:Multiprotein-bridging factor 1 family protein n=1 Tax=Bosea minatitlanensis TaxID=128782 RepID=A0ABW0EZ15_9HYPH|nr:helix-turn-helix transcriptional regulator [Bosea minatitlanensis]MCT4495447.1 helix-turn-helix domain-containing protein [Bosea minatitlanensis]
MLPAHQSRAARALLGWSQTDLANASRVSISTIRDYETEKRVPIPNNLAAIRAALEAAGIQFVEPGIDPQGSGVVLRKA